jgi:hypothetical protein
VLGSSRNLLLSALIASAAVALSYGFDVAIGVLALLYLVDMVVLCLFIAERRGAELASGQPPATET